MLKCFAMYVVDLKTSAEHCVIYVIIDFVV